MFLSPDIALTILPFLDGKSGSKSRADDVKGSESPQPTGAKSMKNVVANHWTRSSRSRRLTDMPHA
jgi:hypothetical protein